jgi:hypothetical protein
MTVVHCTSVEVFPDIIMKLLAALRILRSPAADYAAADMLHAAGIDSSTADEAQEEVMRSHLCLSPS